MSHDETQPFRPEAQTGADDREANLDRAIAAFLKEADAGHAPNPQEWIERYPDLADGLTEFFADREKLEQLAAPMRDAIGPAAGSKVRYFGDRRVGNDVSFSSPNGPVRTEVRRSSAGRPRVIIYYTVNVFRRGKGSEQQTRVIEVDSKGETIRDAYLPPNASLVCRDLDGDGNDETCVLTDNALLVYGDDLNQPPRWKWPRPEGKATILDVATAESDKPAAVIVAVNQQVYAIAQGNVQWRSGVRDEFTGPLRQRMRQEFPQMLTVSDDCLPRFVARYLAGSWYPRQGVVVRQAAATKPDGHYPPPAGEVRPYEEPVHDIRQFQPLPWADAIELSFWFGLAAIALAATANFLVFRWGRRPPLSGVMLVIMTVVALALVGGLSPVFVPVVVFFYLLIRRAAAKRRRYEEFRERVKQTEHDEPVGSAR